MRLKAIEMQGFKSFPEKTKMVFDGGMTAIIGPNGSGKSNISDAIRWVLGEMSAKSLRGSKMEDVIFNGSGGSGGKEKRLPANYAVVSIYLDTSEEHAEVNGIEALSKDTPPDAMPKIRLSDEEEFVITRKYYRTGESEYYVNKKQVRLKDVYELFYDTGIGREGYSVVGQGKIADVLSVKGDERRSIFEEASGISRFRYKKAEAERKLRDTDLNLSRVNDILSEVEGRVEPLAREAENAKKYLVLSKEKKQLEVTLWLEQTDSLRVSLDSGERAVASSKLELDLAGDELDAIEKEEEAFTAEGYNLMQRKTTLERRSAELAAESAELVRQNSVFENDEKHYREKTESNRREAALVEARRKLVAEQLESATREYTDINSSAEALKAEGRTLTERRDAIMKPAESVLDEKNNALATVARATDEIAALSEEAASCRALISAALRSGDESDAQLEQSNTRLAELKEKRDSLEALNNAKLGELSTLKAESVAASALVEKLTESVAVHEKAASSLRMKSVAAEQQRESLLRLERLFEGYSDSVRTVMRQSEEGRIKNGGKPVKLRGTVASLLSTEGEYVVAIETALGASVQFIVAETESDAKAALGFLKTTGGGRITVLPLDTVKGRRCDISAVRGCAGFVGIASDLVTCEREYKGIADELLGRTVIAEDLDKASVMARKAGYSLRIVTKDGQIINAGGSYTGGSSQKKVGLFTRGADIEKLDEEIVSLNSALIDEESARRSAEKEIARLKADIIGKAEAIEALSAEYEAINREYAGASAIYGEEEARRSGLLGVLARGEAEADSLRLKLAECESRAEALRAEKEAAANTVVDAEERLKSVTADSEAVRERLNALGMELIALNARSAAAAEKKEDLSVRIAEENEKLAEIAEEIAVCEASVRANSETAEANRARIAECKAEEEKADFIRKETDKTLDERERSLPERRSRLKAAQIRKEQAFQSYTNISTGHVRAREEYENVLAKLWDEYELTYTAAEEYRLPENEREKMPSRLNTVKAKIRAMGTINVKAVEEYEEIKARYDFLKTQTDDLNRTERKLNAEIARLNSTMETTFLDTFTAINSAFGKVFAELFGGGSARLELTDPEQPLECGIDIILHPPGKAVKSISLLSGGEQSFAAIALYLALQEINPSPFCIFDEIEAALDEINQARLMDYIKAHCDRTQYLLITHRRGTMERANTLYGVTMREKGVSEYLRLNLTSLGEKLKEYGEIKA